MNKYLKYIDALADDEAPIHKINIDGNTEYKSALGGFSTLTIAYSIKFYEKGNIH